MAIYSIDDSKICVDLSATDSILTSSLNNCFDSVGSDGFVLLMPDLIKHIAAILRKFCAVRSSALSYLTSSEFEDLSFCFLGKLYDMRESDTLDLLIFDLKNSIVSNNNALTEEVSDFFELYLNVIQSEYEKLQKLKKLFANFD
jgi:hypothetical protein